MTVVEMDEATGEMTKTVLGANVLNDEHVQHTVKAGIWFGSYPNEGTPFSFVGCTVAPGFEFDDFELASRKKLLSAFPKYKGVIEKLTVGLP